MAVRRLRVVVALSVLVFTMFGLLSFPTVQAADLQRPLAQTAGVNLLVNPGFEGIGRSEDNATANPGNWTRDTYNGAQYGEIFTPEGWVTWWSEADDFKRPECKVIDRVPPFLDPLRIHKGYYSGMCFAFFGKQNAGYLQVVRNIPAGSVVEGSFYGHAWSCGDSANTTSCGDPSAFYFRVGIDPNGGTDPFSPNIVWSAPYFHYDTFGLVGPVQATVGAGGAATLFMQSYGKWAIKHNDAYMDSAALRMVSQGEMPTPTLEPPPPTSDAPPTPVPPQNTATPRSGGETVHTVVAGDTIFGIALAYGIDPDVIYQLNPGLDAAFLQIGQEIVISGTGGAAPAPTATLAPVEEPTPEVVEPLPTAVPSEGGLGPAAPPLGKASLCVMAFYDANEDMFRQPDANEMLLPNAQMNLLAQSGPVAEYTTDGISEPWCFENLDPGNYILRHTPPSGYTLSAGDGGQAMLTLDEGEVETIELAYRRDANASAQPDNPVTPSQPVDGEEPAEEDSGSRVTNVLNVVLRVSGFIVLALAIAVLVLFVLSRRTA